MNIAIAQNTYKWIGGTDTFSFDMAQALMRLGHTVYYWSTDMNGEGITERHLIQSGVLPYNGSKLDYAFCNQQRASAVFKNICPVLQTLHSKFTSLEFPVGGCRAYVSVSMEIAQFMQQTFGLSTPVILNGIDLKRYLPKKRLREVPKVLSICQGDDSMLKQACDELGYGFVSVPKTVDKRIWNIEDWINEADIVVGIGRSAYSGMACGRCVISWDNRQLNPCTGCGYVTSESFLRFSSSNLTGRGFTPLNTVQMLKDELLKYKREDGDAMRDLAEKHLNADLNVLKYLRLLAS